MRDGRGAVAVGRGLTNRATEVRMILTFILIFAEGDYRNLRDCGIAQTFVRWRTAYQTLGLTCERGRGPGLRSGIRTRKGSRKVR
jgi:hypothetical protein